MPFNGSNGTFTRLYNFVADAAAGIKILAARMDNELNGIAVGLSDCMTRDGQSPPTADIPMGAKKIVNMADPTVATDAATKNYVDTAPLHAADTHTFQNAAKTTTYVTFGTSAAAISTAETVGGGLSTGGMIRATGSSSSNITAGPGVEISWQTTSGLVAAYDRTAVADKTLVLQGSDLQLNATTGTVTTKSGQTVQGVMALGGSALGGVNGQIQFARSDGAANLGNISWQGTVEFRVANNNGGIITHYVGGNEYFRVTGGFGTASNERAMISDAQMPSLRFLRNGVASWYVGGSGMAGDNGFAIRVNASTPALYIDSGNAASFAGTLAVTGAATFASTLGATGAVTFGNTLSVTGAVTAASLTTTGSVTGKTPGVGTSGGVAIKASSGPGTSILQFLNGAGSGEIGAIIVDPGAGKIYFTLNAVPVASIDTSGNLRIAGSVFTSTTP